jgi:hypothetical protein
MKNILEFELDGESVYVEVEESEIGARRTGRREDGVEKTGKKFTEVISRIRPVAEAVFNGLREMQSPDEIGLEFGIKLNATAGVIFAAGGSEATFKVALKWKNEK